MSSTSLRSAARRSLAVLLAMFLALVALLTGAHIWSNAALSPKLGLDLEGGTQIILKPRLTAGATITADGVAKARDIIVQRVDANGVSGAEVTTQGADHIVVSMPGTPDQATQDAISKSSQMQFRPVLVSEIGYPQPTPSVTATPSGSATGSASATSTATATGKASATATASASATASGVVPGALAGATATPTATKAATATASAAATPAPSASASAAAAPTELPAKGTDPTSLTWATAGLRAQLAALDCSKAGALDAFVDDPTKPLVTCDEAGTGMEKYILGPVVVSGDKIKDAAAGYKANNQGAVTNQVEISLTLGGDGVKQYADISKKMVSLPSPQNRLAATLDSWVIVSPYFQSEIPDGRASITGSFTLDSAKALAQSLKFGALPMSFDVATSVEVSPTLGMEQLRYGLVAGLIGLLLVIVYSMFQYRALGLVTVSSIVIAALLTYLAITILGWSHNYRLDMAGVTGLIVAIGFTADSFIVYFERVRDELREGRSLASAVETGWSRAKRTILAADGVNFLAAAVLYVLASANVRGFAFTLGLTTLIDLVVVFAFTHPVVALLARRPFFRDGHRWSGLDPERLGAKTFRYAGRGRFSSAPPAVAAGEGSAS